MPQDAHPTLPAPQRPRRQGTWWIITAPHHSFVPYLPPTCRYLSGQLELGEGGFLHWQFVVCFRTKVSLAAVRKIFGDSHAELTRSEAARDYVHKEDTRVEGTTFELGKLPFNRGEPTDWDEVRELAIAGTLASIPSDVFVRNYNALRRIGSDHYDQLVWSELFQYFGVELELGSHVEPGKKRVWKLTLKTPTANFGMVTKVTDMLSLMNFAEESQSVTYLDGSIGIQSLWKSKDPASPYVHARFGSPPM